MKFAEKVVIGGLSTMAILWFTRVGFGDTIPGWGQLFEIDGRGAVGDGTVAMMVSIAFFVIPAWDKSRSHVMEWEQMKELPWGIIFLLGSGFSLSKAFAVSKLSSAIGSALDDLKYLPVLLTIFAIVTIIIWSTELSSNIATVNIAIPIISEISTNINQNPLLLMIPAVISASYAFCLPVATPPNAIVFASGELSVPDMAKPGVILNIIGSIVITGWMALIGPFVFGITYDEIPVWAQRNETTEDAFTHF